MFTYFPIFIQQGLFTICCSKGTDYFAPGICFFFAQLRRSREFMERQYWQRSSVYLKLNDDQFPRFHHMEISRNSTSKYTKGELRYISWDPLTEGRFLNWAWRTCHIRYRYNVWYEDSRSILSCPQNKKCGIRQQSIRMLCVSFYPTLESVMTKSSRS